MLDIFENKIMDSQKYIDLLVYLCLTFKGITLSELFELAKINLEEWNLALAFFKTYFNCYKNTYWSISNDVLKKSIIKKYLTDKIKDGKPVQLTYHLNLGNQMNKTMNSIRKLEEQSINYFFAQEYYLLKQTIADIENFLVLFNPYTKYDLCRYWQYLEGQGYDPVIEYNKRLESFDVHFEPKPEHLFIIILQISRFFKEFADFETKKTPKFRHPEIKDKFVQVDEPRDQEDDSGDIFAFLAKSGKMEKSLKALEGEYPPGSPGWIFRQPDQEEGWENLEQKIRDKYYSEEKVISYLNEIGLQEEVKRMQMLDTFKKIHETGEGQETSQISHHSENQPTSTCTPLKAHEILNPDIPHQKVQ